VQSVSKRYGDTAVVDGVRLALPEGGVTAIIGPNGAGKSTLLSMISRLLPMSAGHVLVDGLDVAHADSKELARRLAILRQDNHLPLRLTVRDLVAFGRFPHSGGRLTVQDRAHIERAIAYLQLEPLADRYLDEMSGGQRQRAFVAMVLCQDTRYVLLDEPLNSLDMKHAVAMMRILRRGREARLAPRRRRTAQDRGGGAARHHFRAGLRRPHHCHAPGQGGAARAARHSYHRGTDGSLRAADHRARDRRAAHLRVLPLAAAHALGHMALGPGPAVPTANQKPAASTTWRASCVACFWWSGGGSNSRPSHCERDALPAELPPQIKQDRNYTLFFLACESRLP